MSMVCRLQLFGLLPIMSSILSKKQKRDGPRPMSKYRKDLEVTSPEIAKRYRSKLELINGIDPFAILESDLNFSPKSLPPVMQLDIMNYLLLTTSYYTKLQMKAFKSLTAYKYFQSGFVRKIGCFKCKNTFIVVGKVNHSQRLTQPPLDAWVICAEDGSIITGHCTCMAGAGEVCSHIAAVLFAIEYIYSTQCKMSATDMPCEWNIPSFSKVEYSAIQDINFSKVGVPKQRDDVPALEGKDLHDMLTKIKASGSSSVIMRLVSPFSDEIAAELNETKNHTTKQIFNIYKPEYESLNYSSLLELVNTVDLNITEAECSDVVLQTRKQSQCKEWHRQRIGRITASKFKAACHTKIENPSLSLIKSICYTVRFTSKYTEWGLRHEAEVLSKYTNIHVDKHENFVTVSVGLCLQSDLPQFGASPDALVRCLCCGIGCVEIKCPYLLRDMDFLSYVNLQTSCLKLVDTNINLDGNHTYFYQVQCQMKLSATTYCDFIVWAPEVFYCERILFDAAFWEEISVLAAKFHQKVIMPELLARYFTREIQNAQTWCICEHFDSGKPMLCCENSDCNIKWFHLECIGLEDVPPTLWFCNNCFQQN